MTKDVKSGLLEFSDDQKVFVAIDEDDYVIKAVLIDGEGNESALGALPTDEQVQEAVDAWLDDHPEATTTVQDGAITTAKLDDRSVTDDKLAADGIKAEVSDLKTDFNASVLTNADIPIPEGAWIRYSNGEKITSTATNLFVFTGKLPKYVRAFLASETDVLCAIAFYNSESIGTDSYMSSDSVDFLSGTHHDGQWYEAVVPSGAKAMAITSQKPSDEVVDSIILFPYGYFLEDDEVDISKLKRQTFNAKEYCNINGYIDNGGFFNSNVNYKCSDYLPIKSGDSIEYTLSSGTTLPIIAVYDTDKVYQSTKTVKGIAGYSSGTFTADIDGYVRFIYALAKNEVSIIFTNNIPDNISKAIDIASSKSIEVYKKVYSVKTNNPTSGFIDNAGGFTSNALYTTTDYLPIKNGESFKYRLSHGTTLPIIAFYDKTKTYDSTKTIKGIVGYSEGVYIASADGYVRFTYANASSNVWVMFTDIIPDNVLKSFPTNEVPKMNILVLGDSIMGEDNDVTEPLSALSGANVINGAVGGTRATNRGGSDNFQYFDGVNLIQALCTNTWTDQETAVEALKTSYPWFPAKLDVLEGVDMSDIDMILFNWATNDYTGGVAMADIVSAHNTIINTIQTYYPSIRIVVVSPIWRYFDTEQDNKNADNFAYNVNTLKEISNAIIDNAHDKRITVFDAYKNMPLNYKTASTYFNSGSGVHLNAVGGKLFAHYINGFINSIC